jgi:hypothetical protein
VNIRKSWTDCAVERLKAELGILPERGGAIETRDYGLGTLSPVEVMCYRI